MQVIEEKDYQIVWKLLEKVEESKMYIEGVILGQMYGTVLVDSVENPQVAWVRNLYGMSLLFGETTDNELIEWIIGHLQGKKLHRATPEWLQLSPPAFWYPIITSYLPNIPPLPTPLPILDEVLYQCERVNFTFDPSKFRPFTPEELNGILSKSNLFLTQITPQLFNYIDEGLVVPKSFCKSPQVWSDCGGTGYCIVRYKNNENNENNHVNNHQINEENVENLQVVSWACAAGVISGQLEIAIETIPDYRKKGLARIVCSALIEYCLAHSLTPVWNCRRSNRGSVMLALCLGFVEKDLHLPYFHVPISH